MKIETLKNNVAEYVNMVKIQETVRMEKYFNLMTDVRTAFPDTSVRKIEEQIGMTGFGKSQISLGLQLVRDFNAPPELTIFEYSRHSSFLSKLDHDKRQAVSRELHDAGTDKKKVDTIKARFGFGSPANSTPTTSTAYFQITDKNIDAFLERVQKAGKWNYLVNKSREMDLDLVDEAFKASKKAMSDKAKAERRLALKKSA